MDLFPFYSQLNSVNFGNKIDLKAYLIKWFGSNLFHRYKKRFHKSTSKLLFRLIGNSPYLIFFTPNRTINLYIPRFNQNLDRFNTLQINKFRKYERKYRNRKIVSEFIYPVITPHILLYRPDMIFDLHSQKFWNRYLYDWFGISLPIARKITRNESNLLKLVRYIFLASKEMRGLLGYRYVHRYKTIEGIEDRFRFEYVCNEDSFNYIVNTIAQNPTAYISHESSFVQNIILENWNLIPDASHKKLFLSNLLKHMNISLISVRNYVSSISNVLTSSFLQNIFTETQKKYAISNSYRDCCKLNSLAGTFDASLYPTVMKLRLSIEEDRLKGVSAGKISQYLSKGKNTHDIIRMYNSALFRNDSESMKRIFKFYQHNRGYIENFYYLSQNIKKKEDVERITENLGNSLLPSLRDQYKCVLLENSIITGISDTKMDLHLIRERVSYTSINYEVSQLFVEHISTYISLKKIRSSCSLLSQCSISPFIHSHIFTNIYIAVMDRLTMESPPISKYLNSNHPGVMLYSVFKFIQKDIEHHTNQYIQLPNKEFIKKLTKMEKKTTAYDFLIGIEKIEELVNTIYDITTDKSMNLFSLMKKFFRTSTKRTAKEVIKKYRNKSYNGINSAVYIGYHLRYGNVNE